MAPRLLRLIPKPGPWMVRFKQFLAFPMFATAAWLVWVLSLQAGDAAVLGALAGAVLLAFAAWLWQASAGASGRWRLTGLSARRDSGHCRLWHGSVRRQRRARVRRIPGRIRRRRRRPGRQPAGGSSGSRSAKPGWRRLRTEGRPVFINFTAAWCITCIANEKVVLRLDSVRKAVDSARMATLKGDWTRRDPVITAHLAAFGRSGVPLYVIYPPQGSPKKPMVLPQILTEGGTVAAIRSMAAETRRAERPRD